MSKSIEQSVKERVKTISKEQGRPFNELWQEILLERWLARLAKSKHKENFIFKGAMCLRRYIEMQRVTRDLDFLVSDLDASREEIERRLVEVALIDLNDGFTFEGLDIGLLDHTHMKYPGCLVSVVAKLGSTKTKLSIDIGVGDSVKPTELTVALLSTDKAPIFEKEIHLWAYPVETIFSQKLETAFSRADQNSRMKDYHDMLVLVRSGKLKQAKVKAAIGDTFKNRDTEFNKKGIPKSQAMSLQNYWSSYLKSLPSESQKVLGFELKSIINEINQYLKQIGLIDESLAHSYFQ